MISLRFLWLDWLSLWPRVDKMLLGLLVLIVVGLITVVMYLGKKIGSLFGVSSVVIA